MQSTKYYHKCGYPILEVKRAVGPVVSSCFVDANTPLVDKDGAKVLNEIKQCPDCGGTIKVERLFTNQPEQPKAKGPTGYIPARM